MLPQFSTTVVLTSESFYREVTDLLCLCEFVLQVLNRCASANWSERKEGLLGLQALLKNQRTLRSATERVEEVYKGLIVTFSSNLVCC